MIYILNALPGGALIGKRFIGEPCSIDEVRDAASNGAISAIGHEATAQALTLALGIEVPYNRASIAPRAGDMLYVAALRGPRVAEGQILSHEEVEQRGFDFLKVRVVDILFWTRSEKILNHLRNTCKCVGIYYPDEQTLTSLSEYLTSNEIAIAREEGMAVWKTEGGTTYHCLFDYFTPIFAYQP